MRQGPLKLTPELVAIVHRVVEDAGPVPGIIYHSEADYDEVTAGSSASMWRTGTFGCSHTAR